MAAPVFQILAFLSFGAGLFAPREYLMWFVVVAVLTAIISLIRKEQRLGLSVIALILGIALIWLPPVSTLMANDNHFVKVESHGWNKNRPGNNVVVNGTVKNTSQTSVTYFEVHVNFMNRAGQVLDSDHQSFYSPLPAGRTRNFSIKHEKNEAYSSYRLEVKKVMLKKTDLKFEPN